MDLPSRVSQLAPPHFFFKICFLLAKMTPIWVGGGMRHFFHGNFFEKYSNLFPKTFSQIFKILVKKQLILQDFEKKIFQKEKMGQLHL